MATKSIEKNIVITDTAKVERLVYALEHSADRRITSKPVLYNPSVEQVRRMFATYNR